MKQMTITILKKDWNKERRQQYNNPCRCLLWKAIARSRRPYNLAVYYGEVRMQRTRRDDILVLTYSKRRYESALKKAHQNPKLLPMTIKLTPG